MVPAAAVIPAPRVSIRAVAVKTCMVKAEGCRSLENLSLVGGPHCGPKAYAVALGSATGLPGAQPLVRMWVREVGKPVA